MYRDTLVTMEREMAGPACLWLARRLAVSDYLVVPEVCAVPVGLIDEA